MIREWLMRRYVEVDWLYLETLHTGDYRRIDRLRRRRDRWARLAGVRS